MKKVRGLLNSVNVKTKPLIKKTHFALSSLLPFLMTSSSFGDESEIEIIKNVRYLGQGRKLILDPYLPADRSTASRPAILTVHGSGWHTEGGQQIVHDRAERTAKSILCKAVEHFGFEDENALVALKRQGDLTRSAVAWAIWRSTSMPQTWIAEH